MLDKQPGSPAQQEQTAAEFRASVEANFQAGSKRMARIEAALEHNATATSENTAAIKAMTAKSDLMAEQNNEMYQLFQTMRGGFKVLEWFGRLAKWGAGFAAGTAALCKTMGWWPFSN